MQLTEFVRYFQWYIGLSFYCGDICNMSSAVFEMGDRLATITASRKIFLDAAATIDIGRQVGGCCDPFGGKSWVPI